MFDSKPTADEWSIRRGRVTAVKQRAATTDAADGSTNAMNLTLDLGILLALACAFVANLAFFYKYRGANAVAKVSVAHPLRSARALYSSRWFVIGMLIAVASWSLHVGALALAPMSVVQVSLAAGVVFIAVMAERMFGFEVGRRQWLGLISTAVGLVTLGLTLPAMHGAHAQFSDAAMISFEAGLFGIGGLLIMGKRIGGREHHHGVMLGAASGILFGVSDTAIKALTGISGAHGVLAVVLSPWLLVAIGASIVAFYASAKGLQDGEAVPVIAVTGTAANIAGIAGGIIVFGDPMAGSPLGIAMQAAAFVLVVLASALMPAPLRAAGVAATA
jgi:hypothetical protein